MRTTLRQLFCPLVVLALFGTGCDKSEPTPPMPTPAELLAPAEPPTAALPPGHPDISMDAQLLPPDSTATAATPQWTVPDGWEAGRASSVRKGSFAVTSPDGQEADIAVTAFPGDVGGTLANVNRWRGQLGLAPITEEAAAKLTTALDVSGVAATVVDLLGEEVPAGKTSPQRMIVATVPHAGDSWFFKMTGDAPVVEKERVRFLQFVQSVKFE
ncbi:hypothetical protein HQ590_11495 [bacterium]|nr:hypothetical protein [bacterium]